VLPLIFHFTNAGLHPAPREPYEPSDAELQLAAVAWLVPLHARDTYLALAGADCAVHLVSLAHHDEFFQLKGMSVVVI
jgi:hypothetical protein